MTNKQTIIDQLEYVIENLTSEDLNLALSVSDLYKVIREVSRLKEHEECNRDHNNCSCQMQAQAGMQQQLANMTQGRNK